MSYEETISDVAKVVEAVGAGIMIAGRLGPSILLGLEVLIIGDIVRTISVDPRWRPSPCSERSS